jgi:hypothetical protein
MICNPKVDSAVPSAAQTLGPHPNFVLMLIHYARVAASICSNSFHVVESIILIRLGDVS